MDEAVSAIFDQARMNEAEPSRKHHLVPASYLVRWEFNGRLRVTETDTKRTYETSAKNAARETDFYRVESEDLDSEITPPLIFETILSHVEGSGKTAIDLLLNGGVAAMGEYDALAMAQYLAFQLARGRARRREILEMANKTMLLQWEHISDEGIAQHMRKNGSEPTSEQVSDMRTFIEDWKAGKFVLGPQKAELVIMASTAAETLSMTLLARRWWIYHSTAPLITCDEPVVAVGGPPHFRKEIMGVATPGIMMFPLDPHHLLVMFHPGLDLDSIVLDPELLPSETDEINVELASASDRWLFEGSNTFRTTTLSVPPWLKASTAYQHFGAADGSGNELIRSYRPTRWASFPVTPAWPVERWWRNAQQSGLHEAPIIHEEMAYALFNSLY